MSSFLASLGAGISAGSSFLGSVIGNSQNRSNMRLQADLNKQLGDHDREENYRIAKEQLADERAYNDPSAQMARYMKAGLNPNLIYGQVNPNAPSIASSLGASTSGVGSGSAFAPDFSGLTSGAMAAAQIANINADTEKKKKETVGQGYQNEILKTDAAFEEALKLGQLDLNYSQIQLNNFNTELTGAVASKTRKETANLDIQADVLRTSIDEARSRIDKMDAEKAGQLIDNRLKEPLARSQMAQIASIVGLNNAQIPLIGEQIKNMVLSGESIKLGNIQIGIENEQLQFNLESDKNFKNVERAIAGAREVVGMVTDVVDTFNPISAVTRTVSKVVTNNKTFNYNSPRSKR